MNRPAAIEPRPASTHPKPAPVAWKPFSFESKPGLAEPTAAPVEKARAFPAPEPAAQPPYREPAAYASEPEAFVDEPELNPLDGFERDFSAALDEDLAMLEQDLVTLDDDWRDSANEPPYASEQATGDQPGRHRHGHDDHAYEETGGEHGIPAADDELLGEAGYEFGSDLASPDEPFADDEVEPDLWEPELGAAESNDWERDLYAQAPEPAEPSEPAIAAGADAVARAPANLLSLEDELEALLRTDRNLKEASEALHRRDRAPHYSRPEAMPTMARDTHQVSPERESEAAAGQPPKGPSWLRSLSPARPQEVIGRANYPEARPFWASRRQTAEPVAEAQPSPEDDLDSVFRELQKEPSIAAVPPPKSAPPPQAPVSRWDRPSASFASTHDDEAPELVQTLQRAESQEYVPAIETVEMQEAPAALEDDLEIPELSLEEETMPTPVDELEAEFASLFNEATEQAAAATGGNGAVMPHRAEDEDELFFAEFMGTAATGAAATSLDVPPSGAAMRAEAAPRRGADFGAQRGPAAGHEVGAELDQMLAGRDPRAEQAKESPRRRGLIVAAVVVLVAAIGGAGAMLVSFRGTDEAGAPAIIKADEGPVKVKPENQDQTSVPSQESEVYQRAAGNDKQVAPSQQKLVTTTEEPVDLSNAATAPDAASSADAAQPQTAAKSDARIEPQTAPQTEGVGASSDLAVVTPRRVRTMVVKPDGTLVERPEAPAHTAADAQPSTTAADSASGLPGVANTTVPAETTAAAQQNDDNAMQAMASGDASGGAVTVPASDTQASAGAPVQLPEKVSVVPSQPNRDVAPQPQPQTQVASRTPAVAPATTAAQAAPAAASEWSMQIASQPTPAGAQSTYDDLAKRYADIIGGLGVNIVKADIEGRGTYYRVRIPSASRDAAIALCARYKAAGGSCFVSK